MDFFSEKNKREWKAQIILAKIQEIFQRHEGYSDKAVDDVKALLDTAKIEIEG